MRKLLLTAMLLLGSVNAAFALIDEGKIFQIWSISDMDDNVSIRGQVQVYIMDQYHYYVIPPTETNQKNMLSLLLSAQAQDRTVTVLTTGGIGSRIQRVTIN